MVYVDLLRIYDITCPTTLLTLFTLSGSFPHMINFKHDGATNYVKGVMPTPSASTSTPAFIIRFESRPPFCFYVQALRDVKQYLFGKEAEVKLVWSLCRSFENSHCDC